MWLQSIGMFFKCAWICSQSWLVKIGLLILAYFTPVREVVHIMLIFLFLDLFSGIWASIKEDAQKIPWYRKIVSSKLRRTVYKFIWYTVAVMGAWMLEVTFKLQWLNLANIIGGFICFVEFKSILENATRITGDPIFMKVLKILKNKGSETIKEIDDEPDDNVDLTKKNN